VPDNSVFNDEALQFKQSSQLQGKQVYTYGSPTPASAFIDEFVPGSVPTIKVVPSLAGTPTGGYLILDYYRIEELKDIVEKGIKAAGKHYFPHMVASLALVATQYQYSIPSGMAFIHDMHFVPTTGTDYEELDYFSIPRRWWRVEDKKIIFNPEIKSLDDHDNDYIEIQGQGRPDLLSTDSSTYDEVLEEYLVAYAVEKLSLRRMGEGEAWRYKYFASRDLRKEEEDRITTGIRANAVRTGL
jgi:hypothetical protein